MVTRTIQTAILGIAMAIGVPVFCLAQSSQTKADTYTWNGELVSVETTAKTMTVKSRVAYQETISELKNFKAELRRKASMLQQPWEGRRNVWHLGICEGHQFC